MSAGQSPTWSIVNGRSQLDQDVALGRRLRPLAGSGDCRGPADRDPWPRVGHVVDRHVVVPAVTDPHSALALRLHRRCALKHKVNWLTDLADRNQTYAAQDRVLRPRLDQPRLGVAP